MRKFLLIILMSLLPLQSFAVVVAGVMMVETGVGVELADISCHDEVSDKEAEQANCCTDSVSCAVACQAMCGLTAGLIHNTQASSLQQSCGIQPLGLAVLFDSALLAHPHKPPIS